MIEDATCSTFETEPLLVHLLTRELPASTIEPHCIRHNERPSFQPSCLVITMLLALLLNPMPPAPSHLGADRLGQEIGVPKHEDVTQRNFSQVEHILTRVEYEWRERIWQLLLSAKARA